MLITIDYHLYSVILLLLRVITELLIVYKGHLSKAMLLSKGVTAGLLPMSRVYAIINHAPPGYSIVTHKTAVTSTDDTAPDRRCRTVTLGRPGWN